MTLIKQTYIFAARSDTFFIKETLPSLIELSEKADSKIKLILDIREPSGVLGNTLEQRDLKDIVNNIENLQSFLNFNFEETSYDILSVQTKNKQQFNFPYKETHCFRGYPIIGSFKQFLDTNSKYILHLDCDMIFYEDLNFSWVNEGVRVMEENEDILCVLPRGGPPTNDGSIYQGTTDYRIDKKRGLYLFKNFTSRHYLIHRERFMSLLPLKPLWLSWREPLKSRLMGNGKMLCWENMVEQAMHKSNMWRADLMTDQCWSLHPTDRSKDFYDLLPKIIKSVKCNKFPDQQRGHFDLHLEKWSNFLNQNN